MTNPRILAATSALLILSACQPPVTQNAPPKAEGTPSVRGQLSLDAPQRVQATMGEATQGATVSLIDAATGNTVASSITDAAGAFVLSFTGFTPANGSVYMLEAIKGLSVGGTANRAGASAVRLRSYLFWNSGWQSFTNTTVNSGIIVGNATTALSSIVSHKQQAGSGLTLSNLIGKISETTDTFTETGTGLSNANDFQKVLPLVGSAIALDQDPLGAIAYNRVNGSYSLAIGVPWISGVSPAIAVPGGSITLKGSNLDKLNGRNAFWFGSIAASTWSVSADRTTATVAVPAGAYSAPLVLQQPDGVTQTVHPFLKLRGTVGTYAGNGIVGNTSGPAIHAHLNSPQGVTMDAAGNTYIVDYTASVIKKVTPSGYMSVFAGSGVKGDLDGPANTAQFFEPTDLTIDAGGTLYMTEAPKHRVRKITPNGTVTTLAGTGAVGGTDGTGTGASFDKPASITWDRSGNLLVVEYTTKKIRRITPAGVVTTLSSTGGFVSNPGAPLVLASLTQPYGLAMDSQGSLFVGDDGAPFKVWKINPNTGSYTAFAGNGTSGFRDDPNGLLAQFNGCHDMTIDDADNLYLSDPHDTNLIRKITPAGSVTTLGVNATRDFADGSFGIAKIGNLGALWMAPDGTFVVSDPENKRLRVVTP